MQRKSRKRAEKKITIIISCDAAPFISLSYNCHRVRAAKSAWLISPSERKRFCKLWKQYGAQISRTTLANWIIYCSQHYFQPMYDYFHRELLKRCFAMADETRVQVLKEEGRRAQTQSFMWLFRSGEDGLPTIILYGYSPTRGGEHLKDY